MERAEARRLQPHYVESFFHEAFGRLGGTSNGSARSRRYEVTRRSGLAPQPRPGQWGSAGRVLAELQADRLRKGSLVAPRGQPPAAFVCPGHPLLDVVIDVTLERHRDLLRRGAVLVDECDAGSMPHVLFSIEHTLQDGNVTRAGGWRVISKRVFYVELDADGATRHLHYAPYLDYRPLTDDEPGVDAILARGECAWIGRDLEEKAQAHAVARVVPEHLAEVRDARLALIAKTKAAVRDRLTKEISHWDLRAGQLALDEEAGKTGARLNSGEARRRADALQVRLTKRLADLDRDGRISPRPPVVLGGLLVVPRGLIEKMAGRVDTAAQPPADTQAAAARARAAVMETERLLGFEPRDREREKLGYDIESRVPDTGRLRFIEVKGRRADAETVTVTRNEILCSLNKPDDFILAIVEFRDDDAHRVHYVPPAVPERARLRCRERQLRHEGPADQGRGAAVGRVPPAARRRPYGSRPADPLDCLRCGCLPSGGPAANAGATSAGAPNATRPGGAAANAVGTLESRVPDRRWRPPRRQHRRTMPEARMSCCVRMRPEHATIRYESETKA